MDGFPGFAVQATCRGQGHEAVFTEMGDMHPGDHTAGAALDAQFLTTIGDLPLPCVDPRAESYRLYLAGGSEFAGFIVVGVTRSNHYSRLWTIAKPYGGEFIPLRRGERPLGKSEWDRLSTEVSAMGFWTQSARLLPEPEGRDFGWRRSLTLEGYASGRYHSVSRFAPPKGIRSVVGEFLALGEQVLDSTPK